MKKLKIGISACFFHADPKRPIFKGKSLLYLEQSMSHWVMAENALAYMIPAAHGSITSKELLEELDGLVLQGGSDMSPKSYGEEPLKPEWTGDFIRDQYEMDLIGRCVEMNKPVLGICRGAQVINVQFGGTLLQDIEMQRPGSLTHRDWNIYDQLFHDVEFSKGSKLEKLYGDQGPHKVNSVHHQGLGKLGKNLTVEAISPKDQIIEAIRLDDKDRYVFAVQWHPEFQDPMQKNLLSTQPIIKDFLNECRNRK